MAQEETTPPTVVACGTNRIGLIITKKEWAELSPEQLYKRYFEVAIMTIQGRLWETYQNQGNA